MRGSWQYGAMIALVAAPLWAPAAAQSGGNGFLFHAPKFSIDVRTGYAIANANSDIFNFATRNLTLSKSDFNSMAGEVEGSAALNDRLDLSFSVGYSSSTHPSEFRDWMDNDSLPIRQTTRFERVPLTVGLKYYLTSPGRQVGNFAWIPSKLAVYTGAGVGKVYDKFRQSGDFVDFESLNIFTQVFESDGWADLADAIVGADYSLNSRVAITTQARYVYAKGDMGYEWLSFNKMDLSGTTITAGLHFRF